MHYDICNNTKAPNISRCIKKICQLFWIQHKPTPCVNSDNPWPLILKYKTKRIPNGSLPVGLTFVLIRQKKSTFNVLILL